MKKKYSCPICHEEHEIDKYNFIDSCIGYMWLLEFPFKVKEYEQKS